MSTPLFPTTVCLRLTLLGVAAIAAGCDSTDNPGGKGQVEDTGSGLTNSDDAPENTAPTAPEVRITPADPTTDVAGHCHRIRRRRRRPHHLPLRLVQRWHPVRGAHRGHGVRESVSRDGCDAVSSEYGVKSSSHGMYGGDGNSSLRRCLRRRLWRRRLRRFDRHPGCLHVHAVGLYCRWTFARRHPRRGSLWEVWGSGCRRVQGRGCAD